MVKRREGCWFLWAGMGGIRGKKKKQEKKKGKDAINCRNCLWPGDFIYSLFMRAIQWGISQGRCGGGGGRWW